MTAPLPAPENPFAPPVPGVPTGWHLPPPPSRWRRGARFWIALAFLGLCLLGGCGALAVHAAKSVASVYGRYRLVPPASFEGLTNRPDSAYARQLAAFETHNTPSGLHWAAATYYAPGGNGGALTIVLHGRFGTIISPTSTVQEVWSSYRGESGGLLRTPVSEPAGPLGGKLQCAVFTRAQGWSFPICVWADYSSFAVVEYPAQGTSGTITVDIDALARQTTALRAATEIRK